MKITVVDQSTDNGEYFTYREHQGGGEFTTKVLFSIKKSDIPF